MKAHSFRPSLFSAGLGILILLSSIALAQVPSRQAQGTISNHGWTSTGDLVIGVRLLGSPSTSVSLGSAGENGTFTPYSLEGCKLVCLHSGSTLTPLPHLPRKPFFGPKAVSTTLQPNGTLGMGIAFPKPPPPPVSEDGKPKDYALRLEFPNLFAPVVFKIPNPEKQTAPKNSP